MTQGQITWIQKNNSTTISSQKRIWCEKNQLFLSSKENLLSSRWWKWYLKKISKLRLFEMKIITQMQHKRHREALQFLHFLSSVNIDEQKNKTYNKYWAQIVIKDKISSQILHIKVNYTLTKKAKKETHIEKKKVKWQGQINEINSYQTNR